MPCSKYKSKAQQKACYATDGWKKKVKTTTKKKRK